MNESESESYAESAKRNLFLLAPEKKISLLLAMLIVRDAHLMQQSDSITGTEY